MAHAPQARPDARLVTLHAERGNPQYRLAQALADLEGAGWGMTLAGERALARQLAALLGPGVIRIDERLGMSRSLLAEVGLAATDTEGDWTSARAVWLAEPQPRELERAARAEVPVIVDATLAPGGNWFMQGARFVVYHDAVTLTGFCGSELAFLFGQGEMPPMSGGHPNDLAVAQALREVASLPLRLARAARTTAVLAERLGGRALPFGPTALLLPPDMAPDTIALPGGVVAATQNVRAGLVLTPGLQDAETVLELLRDASERPAAPQPQPVVTERKEGMRPERERRSERWNRAERSERRTAPAPRPDMPVPDRPVPDEAVSVQENEVPLERVTFEAPEAAPLPVSGDETWTPEIVLSREPSEVAPLPIPVSAGPDEPDELPIPDVSLLNAPAPEEVAPVPTQVEQPAPEPEPVAAMPDLPAAPTDAASELTADLSEQQRAVFGRLREWRNAQAKQQGLSTFIIASNATLVDIAKALPYTLAELQAIRGMGAARVGNYGEKILELVRG